LDSSPPQRFLELALAVLPALAAALFAAASFAFASLSGTRRAALSEALSGKTKQALDRYIAREDAIESRWLALRVVGIASAALLLSAQLPFGRWQLPLATLAALLGYGIPAQIARVVVERTAERSAPVLLRLLMPFELLVAPIAAPIVALGNLVGRMVTRQPPDAKVTETEVEIIVNEGELNGALQHDQSEMIRNVLDFGSVTAGELMVPRTHVVAFDVNTPIDEVLRRVSETEHSRYPVYRGTIENVFGVLHVKDLLSRAAAQDVKKLTMEQIVRTPVAFVPESQPASSVLKDMRAGRHHMAIVIDEFGSTNGIVTLEDLIEEIVGDIRDEHDAQEAPIVDLGDGRLMVDASVPIADLSRYLGTELPDDGDYTSLGGFIISRAGRVPRVGSKISTDGMEFLVREADERHVSKVEIVRRTPSKDSMAPRSSRMSAA
jgi:CBS domain containing-hemolysin-like protein